MAYVGPAPKLGQNREVDDISSGFNGSTTAFTLQVGGSNVSPGSANSIIVSVNNVIQNPNTDYTINGSTITFTSAPTNGQAFFAVVLNQGVDTSSPADGSVTTAKLGDDSVTAAKLANTSVTAGSYTTADLTVDAQGRITAASNGNISSAEIADNAVTTAKINADAVTSAKIADDAINSEHYVDGSIDTAHIADSQITTAKIADDAITTAKIGSEQITASEIAGGTLTTGKLADDAVTSAKIADGTIATANIADDAVTFAKMQDTANGARLLGKISSGGGQIQEQTAAEVRTFLNVADGATAGGGKILQVISATKTDTASNSTGSGASDVWNYNVSDLRVQITASDANHKFLIMGSVTTSSGASVHVIVRDNGTNLVGLQATGQSQRRQASSGHDQSDSHSASTVPIQGMITAGDTNEHTFHYAFNHTSGSTQDIFINRGTNDGNGSDRGRYISTITVMEIDV